MKPFLLAILLLLGSLPANATPPRYASVIDTPFGISTTSLYLLRTVSDNEGSYFSNVAHQFLIEQDLASGNISQFWLLGVTRERFEGASRIELGYEQENTQLNPFELLREMKAVPLLVSPGETWGERGPELSNPYRLENGNIVDLEKADGEVLFSSDDILARISAGMKQVLSAMPDDPGPVDPMIYDETVYSRDLADCFVQGLFANSYPYKLFLLSCENGDFSLVSYQIYLSVLSK